MSLKDFLAGLSSDDGQHYYYDASIAPGPDSEEYDTSVHVLVVDQFEEIFTTHLERWLEATQKLAEERERAAMVLRRRARVLASIGVVSLLLAIIAFWSYWEAGRAKDRADAEKQSALRGQSLFLADLARQQSEKLNFTVGMLLALEVLPKSMAKPDRPYVPEADLQLYEAAVNQHERLVLTGHGDWVTHVAFSPE